ncbi:hypothetical protein M569_01010, partial [Genlisea aurea]
MSSSNRHWPSMFKSKPNHEHHHHLVAHRNSYSGKCGVEERTPEPKPRWNPRPEQIRILEGIFNSGMVNPPRDEIRRIRAQLQEYGQVGDANVFYWFQNRKSRSKHKQRQMAKSTPPPQQQQATTAITITATTAPSPSSPDNKETDPSTTNLVDLLNSTANTYAPSSVQFPAEGFLFPMQQQEAVGGGGGGGGGGYGFCDGGGGFLLSELMLMSQSDSKRDADDDAEDDDDDADDDDDGMKKKKKRMSFCYAAGTSSEAAVTPGIFDLTGDDGVGPATRSSPPSTVVVFINEVWFEIGSGPFNVREAFGEDAVLIQSTGHPVLTDEWGVTLQPLQHGGFYYLLR